MRNSNGPKPPVVVPALVVALFIAKSLSAAGFDGQSAWMPRAVGQDELKESRGAVEDKLRKNILGAFSDERLKDLRLLLNGAWDERSVESLGGILLDGTDKEPLQIAGRQWRPIVGLLAHLAKEHEEEGIAEAVVKIFDRLFERAETLDSRNKYKEHFWGYTTGAIAEYGTPDLLTESFWKYLQKGYRSLVVLESVGDRNALQKLQDLRDAGAWPKDSKMFVAVSRSIKLIEMQIEYPELKQISMRTARSGTADILRRLRRKRPKDIREVAENMDAGSMREALMAIADRLEQRED